MNKKHTGMRLPPDLHDDLSGVADALGLTFTSLVTMTLKEALPGLLVRRRRVEADLRAARGGEALPSAECGGLTEKP